MSPLQVINTIEKTSSSVFLQSVSSTKSNTVSESSGQSHLRRSPKSESVQSSDETLTQNVTKNSRGLLSEPFLL